jgi:hypothetical protein
LEDLERPQLKSTYVYFALARGKLILHRSFDLDPLIECDDEYWETKDGTAIFVQPAGKPSRISYWNAYLKLIEIYGFALLTIVRVLSYISKS